MKKFMCDFETSVWCEDESYVWAWCFCEIGNEKNIKYGNNIDTFFEELFKYNNVLCFFHNLKFDGEFILYYLIKHGYNYVKRENKKNKSFTTLISSLGLFYSIEVFEDIENNKRIKFYDSLKIINNKVEKISKDFNLTIKKLQLDYNKPRELNHKLTEDEIDYIKNDVLVVSYALNYIFSYSKVKMTSASIALADFKKIIGKKFYSMFKSINYLIDKEIRESYKGGFTYLNPIYKNKITSEGYVLDVNSLYPYVMRYKLLPINEPIFFDGKYKEDKIYPLYIQRITCSFELKKGKIPTIQIKKDSRWVSNEYLTSSNNEIVALTLTSIDLNLFLEHYNVYEIEYKGGYKFKAMSNIFSNYIDKWIEVKNKATIENNKSLRQVAKLFLNSLYGKFGTSLKVRSKIPYIEDDIVKYKLDDEENKDGIYIPMACFITAYAREITITSSQKIKDYSIKKYNKDMYCYSDTDSIHTLLKKEEIEKILNIDDIKLGYWKIENEFKRAKFIRQKTYIEDVIDGDDVKLKICCAGLPERCYSQVNFDNFKEGLTVNDKLIFKHVKGGVKLVSTEFTIK